MITTRKAGLAPVLGFAALGLAAMPQAHAQTTITAVSVAGGQTNGGSGNYSFGYTFTPTQNLYVTAVGAINNGGTAANPLAHNVQVYQVNSATAPTSGTSVIGQVSVPTTTSDATGSTFTYTSLPAPVLLTSGTAYEIVDSINGSFFYANTNSNLTTNNITVGGGFYTATTGATATATPVATTAYTSPNQGSYEPNFRFSLTNPAAAPEPSQFASFGLGLLGLSGLALKARKRRPASV